MNHGPSFHSSAPKPPTAPAPQERTRTGLGSDTLRQIHEIIADPDNYINKGGAGIVYRLPQGLCIKVMKDRHSAPDAEKYDLGNDVATEAAFAQELSKFKAAGVRSPRYIGFTRRGGPDGITAIIMEELKAADLELLLQNQVETPPALDWHPFMDALEGYINALHDKGIAHNDMAPRNVMVDQETGLPRVIDFGRSIRKENVTPDAWKKATESDWNEVQAISDKLEALFKRRQSA